MPELNVDQVVAGYLKFRAEKAAIKADAESRMEALDAKMQKLEAWIKAKADADGVTSFRTPHGTAFLSPTDYASVADWDKVIDWIKTNDAYDMLDKRVNKTAVRGYMNANKAVPPGVNYGTRLQVNVRKPGTRVEDE